MAFSHHMSKREQPLKAFFVNFVESGPYLIKKNVLRLLTLGPIVYVIE